MQTNKTTTAQTRLTEDNQPEEGKQEGGDRPLIPYSRRTFPKKDSGKALSYQQFNRDLRHFNDYLGEAYSRVLRNEILDFINKEWAEMMIKEKKVMVLGKNLGRIYIKQYSGNFSNKGLSMKEAIYNDNIKAFHSIKTAGQSFGLKWNKMGLKLRHKGLYRAKKNKGGFSKKLNEHRDELFNDPTKENYWAHLD